MGIELLNTAPPDWFKKVRWPIQHQAFAEAARAMGYVPHYASEGESAALVQTRGTWPVLGRLVARAYVYVSNETPQFVAGLLAELKRRGIPFVRFGNTMWGVTDSSSFASYPGVLTERFTFVVDTTRAEDKLFDAVEAKMRTAVRSAQKQGVIIREAGTLDDLRRLYRVLTETGARASERGISITMPLGFFQAILEKMVPQRQAVFYVAEYQDQPIAVMLNFISGATMLYYAGGSLREFSKQNASSLLQWHAIQQCQARGLHRYDLGGCNPNLAESDPRYGVYFFKKRWGGTLEKFYNAEIYLSPSAKATQEFLRNRIWPIYQRLKRV